MDPYNNNYPQQPLYSNHQKLFSMFSPVRPKARRRS